MMWAAVVLGVVVLTLACAWAYFTAQRLNRLHIRLDAALASLQAALERQAALVEALDPGCAQLARAAQAIPLVPEVFDDKAAAEREMMDAITIEHPMLVDAATRVQLAHRFYNDAVTDTRALQTRPIVRGLHLAGTARVPVYFELRS